MKKFIYIFLACMILTSCEKEQEPLASWPEGAPEVIYYLGGIEHDIAYIWINIVNGSSQPNRLAHGDVQNEMYKVEETPNCAWRVARLYNEGSCIRIRTDKFVDCNANPAPDVVYQMKSPDLFGDDEEHTFEYVVDRKVKTAGKYHLNHYHTATALTFDGRTVEPDADGVFVIRLNDK